MAAEPWSARRGAPPGGHESWPRIWSHRERLLEVARRVCMSAEDAEDAVHEAMLRAVERPELDGEPLGDWLRSVTVRLCADRYQQVRREVEAGRRAMAATAGAAPLDEAVCDRDEARWLARRSGELPARQAEALWLRAEDLDVGQVARRMGLSYRTVESLLARARRTLRRALAGTLAAWSCVYPVRRLGAAGQAAVASTAAAVAVLGIAVPAPSRDAPPRPVPSAARQTHPVQAPSVPDEVVKAVPSATGSAADPGRSARPGRGSSTPTAGRTGLGSGLLGLPAQSAMPRVSVPFVLRLPSPPSLPSRPERPSAAELGLPAVPTAYEVPKPLPSALPSGAVPTPG
ncbi:sigma-70 family RNA polymerase sigma factor [Streptomyces sp. NPDC057681]|uniref:RNA polymerase sigma factor n=1 Tax=Streptomyces sp. NPDC057681 TaxID=3346209 RepID=UPI0036AA109B